MTWKSFLYCIRWSIGAGLFLMAIPRSGGTHTGPFGLQDLTFFSAGFGAMALLFWVEIKTSGAVSGRRWNR